MSARRDNPAQRCPSATAAESISWPIRRADGSSPCSPLAKAGPPSWRRRSGSAGRPLAANCGCSSVPASSRLAGDTPIAGPLCTTSSQRASVRSPPGLPAPRSGERSRPRRPNPPIRPMVPLERNDVDSGSDRGVDPPGRAPRLAAPQLRFVVVHDGQAVDGRDPTVVRDEGAGFVAPSGGHALDRGELIGSELIAASAEFLPRGRRPRSRADRMSARARRCAPRRR